MQHPVAARRFFLSHEPKMSHQANSAVVTDDQKDTNRQNKSKSKRVRTLFKKAKELQDATGCKVFLYVKDQYNHIKFGGSPDLSERFKRGQPLLEGSKKKEVNFDLSRPRPTSARHLKSMWPGTAGDGASPGAEIADTFVEEGSSIEGDSVLGDTEESSIDGNMEERADNNEESIQGQTEVQTQGDMGEEEKVCQKEGTVESDCTGEKENEHADEDDEPLSILKKVVQGEVEEEISQKEINQEEISQDDTVYTVAQVRRKRELEGKVEYLVKWKGWAEKYNTWEPEEHILDKQLIADFNSRTKKQKK